jgi:glycosyltransferase involved in cell wall biosynthesis
MKILLKINILLPKIATHLKLNPTFVGGWLVGLFESLMKNETIELAVCFPIYDSQEVSGEFDGLKYFSFCSEKKKPTSYDEKLESRFKQIIDLFKPDLVHIFGTEFSHTLSMVKAYGKPERTIINIQGLTSIFSSFLGIGLNEKAKRSFTLRDLIRCDSINQQVKKFEVRGKYEIEAIKNVNHIIGRTNWDEGTTYLINPNRKYHFCNETLRSSFYDVKWDINKIERHTILLIQAHYPIKGLHFVLSILPNLVKKYPDVKVVITGANIYKEKSLKERLKMTFYAKYILRMIKKNNLEDHIVFLGPLNEEAMAKRIAVSHVFVSPSTIENESNSLSEAKLIGLPSISSYVGGVTQRIQHGKDGFLYPLNETYMLEYYINKIFDHDDLAEEISRNAISSAQLMFDREINLDTMINIYKEILDKQV